MELTLEQALESVGKGWEPLVREIYEKKGNHNIIQVKEKFGLLRVYAENPDLNFFRFLTEMEFKSSKFCEECGITEGVSLQTLGNNGYWMKTMCINCMKQFQLKRNDTTCSIIFIPII